MKIKIHGCFKKKYVAPNGNLQLVFEVQDYRSCVQSEKMILGERYDLDMQKHSISRSNEQNRMMWGLIRSIAEEENDDEMNVYIRLLEDANAKSDIIKMRSEAEDMLKKTFRAVKNLGTDKDHPDYSYYKVYYGTSKMNTSEMSAVIEKAESWCAQLDIPV